MLMNDIIKSCVHMEDGELVQKIKTRDESAFRSLYSRYAASLYHIINRIVKNKCSSQDTLQEVFIKIWNNIHLYDLEKGKLYTWLSNIAKNSAIDAVRKQNRACFVVYETQSAEASEKYCFYTQQNTDKIGLPALLKKLKPEHYNIVMLLYYQGYTLTDISKELNIPLSTIKDRLKKAIKNLRLEFDSEVN